METTWDEPLEYVPYQNLGLILGVHSPSPGVGVVGRLGMIFPLISQKQEEEIEKSETMITPTFLITRTSDSSLLVIKLHFPVPWNDTHQCL